jgi:hypothetical protein
MWRIYCPLSWMPSHVLRCSCSVDPLMEKLLKTAEAASQTASLPREEPGTAPVPIRRSARLRGSWPPAQRSAEAKAGPVNPRSHRVVDINDECPICQVSLGPPENVARCNHCCNDYHVPCVLIWFTRPVTTAQCGYW